MNFNVDHSFKGANEMPIRGVRKIEKKHWPIAQLGSVGYFEKTEEGKESVAYWGYAIRRLWRYRPHENQINLCAVGRLSKKVLVKKDV